MRVEMQPRYALNKNKYLLPHEAAALESTLDSFFEREPRNCLMFLLSLKTGARAQELLNLKKANLNHYDETVLIHGLKGSNDREIPLHSALFRKLARYGETVEGEILFAITYNRLRDIWTEYRPVQKKLHCLRHTFAIQLYKKTKDVRLVQVALGHRNVMNTMVYADYVFSQTELRRLIL
jgi:integrase